MLKVKPHPDYPPEEGRYIRGNDFSPVAVAVVLNCDADKIPPDLERLVRTGVEAGAALSGTVQTENIGFEKIICNANVYYDLLESGFLAGYYPAGNILRFDPALTIEENDIGLLHEHLDRILDTQ